MAKRKTSRPAWPLDHFENAQQIGGITTAVLDDGPGRGSRVAFVDTGAGLRYTVALDRGADIAHAALNAQSLAYLTPNGIRPPNHAYHHHEDWLTGWPGGLLTTGGPIHFGGPRAEPDGPTNLHGHYSNQPAQVEMLVHPEPHLARHEMLIGAVIRDTRAYGPSVEVRRTIQSTLGHNRIRVFDQTTNRDNRPTPHGMLYHCNFGYPMLGAGARIVLSGEVAPWPDAIQTAPLPDDLEGYKTVLKPSARWAERSRGLIGQPKADPDGVAHVGLINPSGTLAVELEFAVEQLPRVMLWQHYAAGMYVLGIEPMVGTPFGAAAEPDWALTLAPGETRRSAVTIHVHDDPAAIARFARRDQRLRPAKR